MKQQMLEALWVAFKWPFIVFCGYLMCKAFLAPICHAIGRMFRK